MNPPVLPHPEQLSSLRSLSLSLSLASEGFCDMKYAHLDFYYCVTGCFGPVQQTDAAHSHTCSGGCPRLSRGKDSNVTWSGPAGPYCDDFNFLEAAEIFALSRCTQLVSLHLANAQISTDATHPLMAMPRLEELAVRSFNPEGDVPVPVGTCHFKSLTLNSPCGRPPCCAITRLSSVKISDLPLLDLEEIVLCSRQLKVDIEGYDADEGEDPFTLDDRIVGSIQEFTHLLAAGCCKRMELSRLSLILTTAAVPASRYTPNHGLLSPWSNLDGHLQILGIHNFPVNRALIQELTASLPGLPELRLHAADIADSGWMHLGPLSSLLDVLCIWGGDATDLRSFVQPRHMGLLSSKLTKPLVVAVGPPHTAETGLDVMRALGQVAGGLITLQCQLEYTVRRPRGYKEHHAKEEWAREWQREGKGTSPEGN